MKSTSIVQRRVSTLAANGVPLQSNSPATHGEMGRGTLKPCYPAHPKRAHLNSQAVPPTPKAVYMYPDPIPEFAEAETRKFKGELGKVLSEEKHTFGDDLQMVVNVCAEILREFLVEEYGGPGTLLVEPFTDMMVALKEKNLTGAALASRASLLWAQKNVDRDWEKWNS